MNIGLVTLNGNDNFGNKLQHYAVQTYLQSYNNNVKTIRFLYYNKLEYVFKHFVKLLTRKRYRAFCKFDRKITYYKTTFFYKNKFIIPSGLTDEFDSFFVGSDQVWNSSILTFDKQYLLSFAENNKRNSFSASIGIDSIPNKNEKLFRTELSKFNSISVREEKAKETIENLTRRKDVEVLLDPTMLLTSSEWNKVLEKPKHLKCKKYILNYFLGEMPQKIEKEIKRVALENDCEIINLLNKNEKLYCSGPSEFLYLEKNAFLVCTDSFHSCVFAILYNVPFVVFDRVQSNIISTNSRIDTLINKFKLEDRKYNGTLTEEVLKCDFSHCEEILKIEREKADKFLKKALDIK